MGFVDLLFRGINYLLCGPNEGPRPEPAPHEVYTPPTVPHRPQQQFPPSYHSRPDQGHPISQPQPQHKPPQQHKPQQGQQQPQHKPHHTSPSPHRPGVDANQVNQQNEHYTSLRSRANEAGDAMARAFDESHKAYAGGDGARAKQLSEEGKRHKAEMERLNKEASEWIFRENNTDSAPHEVDLHGLYVNEAIACTDRAIQEAKRRGDSEVHLIVGKGLHSRNGAKIKPAIEDLMRKHQLVAQLDPQNAGVLIVSLDGHDKGTGRVIQPDDIARGIEGDDDRGCLIM